MLIALLVPLALAIAVYAIVLIRAVIARKRVFMCTAGTCGLAMWATRLMPVAKKLGSSSAPGIERANSSLKRPPTVETLTPNAAADTANAAASNDQ